MRDAETGQLWEMTRLAEAYTVWLEHLRAQAAELSQQPDDDTVRGTASALLFGGLGLTAPYPASFDEGARRILDLRAADLDAATLYVLSPSMCDVVRRPPSAPTWTRCVPTGRAERCCCTAVGASARPLSCSGLPRSPRTAKSSG
jgi:hypothetical protein